MAFSIISPKVPLQANPIHDNQTSNSHGDIDFYCRTVHAAGNSAITPLQGHLDAAMREQGQVIGLVGEPGMGKTRLLTEFCRHVPGDQVTMYEGRCLSYGQARPYLLVRDLM